MTGNRWLLTGWLVAMAVILVLLLVSRADFEALRTDYDASQEQNTSLSGQLQLVQSDLSQLQADYNTSEQQSANLSGQLQQLQSDYDALSSELAAVKSVYPPRNFSSVSELEGWLASNDVSQSEPAITYEDWYAKALEIQEDALRDGYIISVDYDYYPETDEIGVWCVTVINGDIWYWDPEFDTVSQDTLLGKVE